jgi:hypothetical protein
MLCEVADSITETAAPPAREEDTMSIFSTLAGSKWLKVAVFGTFFGAVAIFLIGTIYVRFHYAVAMPSSPQPETGRIYPVKAQYGVVVYVNEREREFRSFVEEDMLVVAFVCGLLNFFLGMRLGWFKKKPPWDSPDSSAGGEGA